MPLQFATVSRMTATRTSYSHWRLQIYRGTVWIDGHKMKPATQTNRDDVLEGSS